MSAAAVLKSAGDSTVANPFLGIVWAFNGVEPTYDVPAFGEGPIALDTFRNPLTMKVASDSIRFERGCLTRSDEFLTIGMNYIASFPEARPAAGLFD
jgi:hypothetical protein